MLIYIYIYDIYIYLSILPGNTSRTKSSNIQVLRPFHLWTQGPEGGPPESSILAKFWRPGHSKVPFFRYLYDPNAPGMRSWMDPPGPRKIPAKKMMYCPAKMGKPWGKQGEKVKGSGGCFRRVDPALRGEHNFQP